MFGIVSVNRFLQSVAVLLMVALLASAGCRSLSPRHSPSKPPPPQFQEPQIHFPPIELPPIESPRTTESDPYAAFRPIMPGEFVPTLPPVTLPPATLPPPEIISEPVNIEPTNTVPEPDIILQTTIDELNRRITELEAQLEIEREKLPPPPATWEELLPEPMVSSNFTRRLPIINRQGVHVSADDSQNVRIEIADRALFVPNAWQLSAEGEETLRAVATEIRAFDPTAIIDIEGHTDSLMGDPNNPTQKHEISTVKTRAVMEFFVNALRWDVTRISTGSFGRSRPVADNATPEGRARNNRIEIVVRSEND